MCADRITAERLLAQRTPARSSAVFAAKDKFEGKVPTMNYDLAIMALDGLARAPLTIDTKDGAVVIRGPAASFKELARLCLLMGGADTQPDDSFELQPGRHLTSASPQMTLRLG